MKIGQHVKIENLVKKVELNNKIGKIKTKIDDDKRYGVQLLFEDKTMKIKKKNLVKINPNTFIVGGCSYSLEKFFNYFFSYEKEIKLKKDILELDFNEIKNLKFKCLLKNNILVKPIIIDGNKYKDHICPFILNTLFNNKLFPTNFEVYEKIIDCLIKNKYRYIIGFIVEGTITKKESEGLDTIWFLDSVVF